MKKYVKFYIKLQNNTATASCKRQERLNLDDLLGLKAEANGTCCG